MALVERELPDLSLKTQAELLGLSRSGLYYVPMPVSAAEVGIKHAIDEIYTQYPFYGLRRITVELCERRESPVARETAETLHAGDGPHGDLSRAEPEPAQS